MNTENTPSIHEQVKALPNLLAFAKRTGIPYRTLNRIKGDPNYPMSHTTRLALSAALRKVSNLRAAGVADA